MGTMNVTDYVSLSSLFGDHDARSQQDAQQQGVVYTWEMAFNGSLVARPSTEPPPLPFMPPLVENIWISLFTAMLAVGVCGNLIVIWIVIAHPRMRTVTNYFLVNLSIADLMMALLNCLFNFMYMLRSDWVFGERYCQINNFLANVTVAASVFTLTGISFDRYQAIVRPMRPRMSKTFALITIVGIWICGMLLSIPCLLYSTTKEYRSKGMLRTACLLSWPDGLPNVSRMDLMYQFILFIVTYVLPMLGMIFFYSAMGIELWGSKSIGELTQRQADSIRSKRKVVKMFILVVFIFGLCWLPYHAYFIYAHFSPSILYNKHVQHVYLGFYWLAMATSMVNPIIYYWMNAKFRSYFHTAIQCPRLAVDRCRGQRPAPRSPGWHPEGASSGSRSRSGLEDLIDSSGNAARIFLPLTCRGRPLSFAGGPLSYAGRPLPLQRPPLPASCSRCPRGICDPFIHGRKV